MKIRQLVQYLVFPKSFNILSFYSKGHYSIRIRLTAQDNSNAALIHAFPIIFEGREAKKEQGKRAKVNLQELYFESEQFYITFSQQKVIFNTAVIFKIEYEEQKEYTTYLDFDLIHTKYTKHDPPNHLQEPIKKVRIATTRRLYINNYQSLNTFKRVLFDDSDYFSLSDVYLAAQSMGQKIRIHDYQYGQFGRMSLQERGAKHQLAELTQREMSGYRSKNIELMVTFGISLEDFYSKMITQKLIQYGKLCQNYSKFRFHMATMNNSSILEFTNINQLQWIRNVHFKSESQIMETYQSDNLPELFMLIYQESHLLIKNIKLVWKKMMNLLLGINFNLMELLAQEDIKKYQQTKETWLLSYEINTDERETRRQHFIKKREQMLQTLNLYEDMDAHHPYIMIQNYDHSRTTKSSSDITSLVIFIHGYQGSTVDMQKARNFLSLYNQSCYGLIIKAMEDDMDQPIQKLGELVSGEIIFHLQNTPHDYQRINFIGYSLGGIIARETVKYLTKYQSKMNMFVSFASPHAGICDSSNPFVKTGIWFLTNFEKNKNLKQLNCQPIEDSPLIFLEMMAKYNSISWFKKFVAVNSKEDGFIPHESSRLNEQNLDECRKEMCINLKERIHRLQRVQVWFDIEHDLGTFDKITGRRSHIEFLENRIFLQCFFSVYGPLF